MFKFIIKAVQSLLSSKEKENQESIEFSSVFPPSEGMNFIPWTKDLPETAILGICVCLTIQKRMEPDEYMSDAVTRVLNRLTRVKTEAELVSVKRDSLIGLDIMNVGERYLDSASETDTHDLVSIFSPLLSKHDDYTLDLRLGDKDFDEQAEKAKKALVASQKNAESQLELLIDLIAKRTKIQKKAKYSKENLLVNGGVLDLTDKKFSNLSQNGIVTVINRQLELSRFFDVEINCIKISKKYSGDNVGPVTLPTVDNKTITFDFV